MAVKDNVLGFQWDKGNLDKSYQKHGITPEEAEEIFLDEKLKVESDVAHSQTEERLIAIGQTQQKVVLLVVFTTRSKTLRIISARKANQKEKQKYAQT